MNTKCSDLEAYLIVSVEGQFVTKEGELTVRALLVIAEELGNLNSTLARLSIIMSVKQ